MSTVAPPQLGDETKLFRAHDARLRAIVGREVRTSRANIDDACAFAWLQMLRYQPARETLLTWLCRTAIREAIKLDRRARRWCELVSDGDTGVRSATIDPLAEDRLEMLAAWDAVVAAGLRSREARVLALHAAGHSYRETAAAEDITTRTVERQLMRAKRKLRDARRAQHAERR
jgi:RNA polymerase sigma factor (sigma-70 family)